MRWGTKCAIANRVRENYLVVFLAPTRDQARGIFWDHVPAMIPSKFILDISESHLEIDLVNGSRIAVVGMDKPARIEGKDIDLALVDEMGEMREGVWSRTLRPALSAPGRPGSAWLFGVPRMGQIAGSGVEFKKLARIAKSKSDPDFEYFHWKSADVADPGEIEAARRTMDKLMFAQEYEAERVSRSGRAYYSFKREIHARETLPYNPRAPLIFMFDFGITPGVAVVGQEQRFRQETGARGDRPEVADEIIAIIGEVYIDADSNTPSVCRKLIADWGHHKGEILCYGDPSGGSRTTKNDGDGTDWTTIRTFMQGHFEAPGSGYVDRVAIRGPGTEEGQRLRVNALNNQLQTADGLIHLLIDPVKAPHVVEDFEETVYKPGTDGELYKPSGTPYTHLTDSIGYFCVRAHPYEGPSLVSTPLWG